MNTPNEDGKPTDNMESLKQQAAGCGPGCDCNATGTPGKARWVIGAIVLVAAGVMAVQAINKGGGTTSQADPTAFAAITASPTGESGMATNSAATTPAVETSVGTSIGTLAELNTVAKNTDAVFIFLPGKDEVVTNAPSAAMRGAARMIESKAAIKCGLFTLQAGSLDYDKLAGQITLPGVLAMVKGRGMSAISGDITEAKLVQGFVAASSAGGCGPSGCGPSGCN